MGGYTTTKHWRQVHTKLILKENLIVYACVEYKNKM